MVHANVSELLGKLEILHSELEKKLQTPGDAKSQENTRSHGDTLRAGQRTIESLKRTRRKGFDGSLKDQVLWYVATVITEVYHVEGSTRGPYREHFKTHVVLDDVGRFKIQNDYLNNWIKLLDASKIANTSLVSDLKATMVKLRGLESYARKRGRADPAELTKMAKSAYAALHEIATGSHSLRALALTYHERN